MDGSGNVIVADGLNEAIRAIAPDGTVTTIAGGSGKGARDGPCEEAQFAWPVDVAVDAGGSIYVADSSGKSIRRIDTGADCSVTTVAGQGPVSSQEEGWGGFRDGPAAEAEFRQPSALAFQAASDWIETYRQFWESQFDSLADYLQRTQDEAEQNPDDQTQETLKEDE